MISPPRWCVALGLMVAFQPQARAAEIPPEIAMQILVSEAADQGLKGMVCVGEVLRRRGSTKGFYGYRFNHRHHPKSVWKMAEKAWRLSAHTKYTKGADHFENIRRFGHPWWVKNCVKTYEYKDHIFYKELPPKTRK